MCNIKDGKLVGCILFYVDCNALLGNCMHALIWSLIFIFLMMA